MYIIGVTGGTGAGKSSALKVLHELGALALDCDAIYHELLSDCTEMITEIKERFDDVLSDGKIDRHKLAKIVWNDPSSLQELNKITHQYVSKELERRINTFAGQGGSVTAIDAIALIESGQSDNCDIVVGIIAPREVRIERIIKRDNLSREMAEMRINAQNPENFYKENCDYILENIYDTQAEFEEKCKYFFKKNIF